MKYLFLFLSLGFLAGCGTSKSSNPTQDNADNAPSETVASDDNMKTLPSIHEYSFLTLLGDTVRLSDFKGKKMLLVNTASECGYTPQYEGLQKLYDQYKDRLVVVGFPSNDFGGQEPGTNEEIHNFCTGTFHVTFPVSEKINIKEDTHPIYQWLTRKSMNGVMDSEVKWNFQKYLIDENGQLLEVFGSKVEPLDPQITAKL